MGKGKSKARLLKEQTQAQWLVNMSVSARNLRKNELGAVIFGTKHHTINECLTKKIFGLPDGHFSYVRNVTPGLMLFLFNYSDRTLHGVFEATTSGQRNINPHGWTTSDGSEPTPYAAQVRVEVRRRCRPLAEEEFKPIIIENYYAERLFWFELDKEQAEKLTRLFLSSPLLQKNRALDIRPSSDLQLKENSWNDDVEVEQSKAPQFSSPDKKWTGFFNPSSSSYAAIEASSDQYMQTESASSFWETVEKLPVASPYPLDSFVGDSWEEAVNVDTDVTDKCEYDEELYEQDRTFRPSNHMDMEGSDFYSVVAELMNEIEGLKLSQLNQAKKIEYLEHELQNVSKRELFLRENPHKDGTDAPETKSDPDIIRHKTSVQGRERRVVQLKQSKMMLRN